MRDLNELNLNEGGVAVERKAPTEEQIGRFEERFKVKLPPSYLELINHSNGGHPELDSFYLQGNDDYLASIDHFYHLGNEEDDSRSLWYAAKMGLQVFGSSIIPIGADGGGNQIVLSLNKSGAVEMAFHDENFELKPVCDSFEAFVDLLQEDPDML